MDWFIGKVPYPISACSLTVTPDFQQGTLVREEEPTRLNYWETTLVALGHPAEISKEVLVFSDPRNRGAPMYEDHSKQPLPSH